MSATESSLLLVGSVPSLTHVYVQKETAVTRLERRHVLIESFTDFIKITKDDLATATPLCEGTVIVW